MKLVTGGQRICLKSDGESSIVALKKRTIAAGRLGTTWLIESPVRESRANGACEMAVNLFQSQLRTFKHQYESRMGLHSRGERLSAEHRFMEWSVLWATEILNKFRKRPSDGRTSYEIMAGHACRHSILEVGETATFKVAMGKSDRHKADSDWHDGTFLGVQTRSTEFIIEIDQGLYRTSHHNVRRVVKEKAFQNKCLDSMTFRVENIFSKGASTSSPGTSAQAPVQGGGSGGRGDEGKKGYIQRSFRITEADGRKYGHTPGCPGCTWIHNKLGPRQNPSEECD